MAKITMVDENLAGSTFEHVDLSGTSFRDIGLRAATFHDIDFSDATFTAAQIGGCRFRHIGPPPGGDAQRPVTFEDATLAGSVFRDVDLTGVRIEDCKLDGMTIDGVLVTDLLDLARSR
jgi:uncharacterized protein YjbI with pentapeptide repeats